MILLNYFVVFYVVCATVLPFMYDRSSVRSLKVFFFSLVERRTCV